MPALEFTPEEQRRPHGHIEAIPGFGYRRWDAACMFWKVFDNSGGHTANICPDHERLTREETECYQAGIRRILGEGRL